MYLITFDQITHIIIVFIKIWHILMSIYDWRLQPAEAEFVSGQAFAYFHQLLQFVLGMDAYTSWATVLDPQVNNIQHRVGNRVIRIPQLPWTMSTLWTSPSIEGLLLALRNGSSCAVSDGSFYPNEKVVAAACRWHWVDWGRRCSPRTSRRSELVSIAVNWEGKLVLFHV